MASEIDVQLMATINVSHRAKLVRHLDGLCTAVEHLLQLDQLFAAGAVLARAGQCHELLCKLPEAFTTTGSVQAMAATCARYEALAKRSQAVLNEAFEALTHYKTAVGERFDREYAEQHGRTRSILDRSPADDIREAMRAMMEDCP